MSFHFRKIIHMNITDSCRKILENIPDYLKSVIEPFIFCKNCGLKYEKNLCCFYSMENGELVIDLDKNNELCIYYVISD